MMNSVCTFSRLPSSWLARMKALISGSTSMFCSFSMASIFLASSAHSVVRQSRHTGASGA